LFSNSFAIPIDGSLVIEVEYDMREGLPTPFDSFVPAHLAPAGLPLAFFRAAPLAAWVLSVDRKSQWSKDLYRKI
jgi:hypothetical protein